MSTSQRIANRFEIKDLEKDLLGRGGRKRASWECSQVFAFNRISRRAS
jgi:hypothetical protein